MFTKIVRVFPPLISGLVLLSVISNVAVAQSLEKIPCPAHIDLQSLIAGEIEGETYECGLVTVPEDYDNFAGKTIDLVYLRAFSKSSAPAPEPLVYLSGGPGGSALHEISPGFTNLPPNLAFSREDRDVIVYDQRGTGLSNPILCGPTQAALGVGFELLPELAPDITAIENDADAREVYHVAVCAGAYANSGTDLSQYNSIASARDIALIATVLGYGQYDLYGTSYGTKLAQVAVHETPDRVRNIVLDGTTPLTGDAMVSTGIEFAEQFEHIFDQCKADPECGAAYPNLQERFIALLDKLKTTPIILDTPIVPEPQSIFILVLPGIAEGLAEIGADFFQLVAVLNNKIPNHDQTSEYAIVQKVPKMIAALEKGDVDYVRAVFENAPKHPAAQPGGEQIIIADVKDENAIIPDNAFVAQSIETLLLIASQETAEASTPGQQWVKIAFDDLSQRLSGGEPQTEVLGDMIELSVIPVRGNEKEHFYVYANERLPSAKAAEANAIVDAMTEAELRETRWFISDIAASMSFEGEAVLGLHTQVMWAVNCPESVVLHTQADVDAAVAASPFPQLFGWDDNKYQLFEIACSFFPPTEYITEEFIIPTNSDKPALFLQGALDTQTPLSGAQAAADFFPNNKFILFESEGHVISGQTQGCPGIIAAQFLKDPGGTLDASCANEYVVQYELP